MLLTMSHRDQMPGSPEEAVDGGATDISPDTPTVFIVDDDPSIGAALSNLLEAVGYRTVRFETAEAFVAASVPDTSGCLVLDVRMPGMSGIEFQDRLEDLGIRSPVVFITGHGDVPTTVRAMKAGAIDFLTKPFHDVELLDAVSRAIERDRERRSARGGLDRVRHLHETLTPRERDVLGLVTQGLLNKQIAYELGIAEITVKIHRGHLMRKMEARSITDLVRQADLLGLGPNGPPGGTT